MREEACGELALDMTQATVGSNLERQRYDEEGGQLKEGREKERARNNFLSCRVDNRITFREI